MIERHGKVRGVLEGQNGRLFLGDQDGFTIGWFLSRTPFNRPLLEMWKRALRRRARELRRRGVPYVFYLAPDAHHMYPEDLPPEILPSGHVVPGEIFLNEMAELRDITFVSPRADLLAAKGGLEIYRKTDSHWTQYGSFVAYQTLCRALEGIVPLSEIEARDITFEYRRSFGDLGVLVEPERSEETVRAKIARNDHRRIYDNEGFDRTACFETIAPGAAETRAFILRDSFMTDQFDYIGRTFRHVLCAGTTTSFFLDEVDAWKPHVVITHIGERRLYAYAYEPDHRLETFDDVFRTDYASPRGRAAQKAMLLLRAGRAAEALPHVEDFEADPALQPDHAFIAARVLGANELNSRAYAVLGAALHAHPERPSYLALGAKLQLSLGGLPQAADFAERAVAAAPYNGYHHETYAYLLLSRGDAAGARTYLDEVLHEIDDYGVLWYQLSLACEALGDRLSATDAIIEALLLDSSDATYRAHAVKLWQS